MVATNSALPRVNYSGFDDKSPKSAVEPAATYAQHSPVIPLLAEDGKDVISFYDTLAKVEKDFGSKSLSRHSQYYTRQVELLKKLLEAGNGVYIKRLVPTDAAKASITLCADVLTNKDGTVSIRYIQRWMAEDQFYANKTLEGVRKLEDGTVSVLYPLLYLRATCHGDAGNRLGIRLFMSNNRSLVTQSSSVLDKFHVRLPRLQIIKKDTDASTPNVVKTTKGSEYVEVSFKKGVYDPDSEETEFFCDDVFLDNYFDPDTAGAYAPFERISTQVENVEHVQSIARDAILAKNSALAGELVAPGMVNIFTGTDMNGVAYPGLTLEGALDGGLILGEQNNVYAAGGLAGTINEDTHDLLARQWFTHFGEDEADYLDSNVYPFSGTYDMGYTMETKYAMIGLMAKRDDLKVVCTTYMYTDTRPLTLEEEISRGEAIKARMTANPESVVYGTPACRGDLVYLSGRLIGSGFRGRMPLLLDYAYAKAKMSGASSGIMQREFQQDVYPNNKVTIIGDLNIKSFNLDAAKALWMAGGIWARMGDRRQYYYPCLRSIHVRESSVLLSAITVDAMCDVVRTVKRLHERFSGNATLTEEQICSRTDAAIIEALRGKYADRLNFKTNTYLTDFDKASGTSWSTDLEVYANTPRNVWNLHIVSKRQSDYS